MLKIDDLAELSVLHKALLEAKFSLSPINEDITGNPTLADISNRVYDELANAQGKKLKGSDIDLQNWRRIKTTEGYRGFWRRAVINARRDMMFSSASENDKRTMVKCFLSPFTCTENEIDEFIAQADISGEKRTLKWLSEKHTLNGASLMKFENVDENTVHLTLWLVSKKTCDIFFSGVKKLSVTNSGKKSLIPPELSKLNISSSNGESFSGTFTRDDSKCIIEISSERVDYWL